MKGYTAAMIILAFCQMYSQTELTNHPDEAGMVRQPFNSKTDIVHFAAAEVKPEFPGGIKAFQDFLLKNIKLPDTGETDDVKLRVYFSFIVERDGSLSDIKILRDSPYAMGTEITKALKLSPKWNPGQQGGKTVRTRYSLPLTIVLPGTGANDEKPVDIIYPLSKADTSPLFAQGVETIEAYINKKINAANLMGLKPGTYSVPLEIVIANDGVMDFLEVKGEQDVLKQEVIRILRRAPQWIPATLKGKKVAVRMNITVKVIYSKL